MLDADAHRFDAALQLPGELLRLPITSKNSDLTHGVPHLGRQLPQRNPKFPPDHVGMNFLFPGLIFERALQGPHGGQAAATRNHHANAGLADGQRQHAARSFIVGGLQRGNSQRKTDGLEFRRSQCFFQPDGLIARNRNLCGIHFSGGRTILGIGN